MSVTLIQTLVNSVVFGDYVRSVARSYVAMCVVDADGRSSAFPVGIR